MRGNPDCGKISLFSTVSGSSSFHVTQKWEKLLAANGLTDFAAIWALPQEWVDTPNRTGGGWSAVSRHEIEQEDGTRIGIYAKRQEDYFRRKKIPFVPPRLSMDREIQNILRYASRNIPCMEVIAWGMQQEGGRTQGLVLTAELIDFAPLKDLENDGGNKLLNSLPRRRKLIAEIAEVVAKLHSSGLRHGMLYPKHIYVREKGFMEDISSTGNCVPDGNVCLIDLEGSKKSPISAWRKYKDLGKLNRFSKRWSTTDRLYFFQCYCGHHPLNWLDRIFFRFIAMRTKQKQTRRIRRDELEMRRKKAN